MNDFYEHAQSLRTPESDAAADAEWEAAIGNTPKPIDREVAELLDRNGIDRDQIENAEQGSEFSPTLTAEQFQRIEFLSWTKRIDAAVECRKQMQCEILELDEDRADIFIANLQQLTAKVTGVSDTERIASSNMAAESNSAGAAQSVVSGMVPEFGAVLAKREPTALAYGFPPAVDALIVKAKLSPEQTSSLLSQFGTLFARVNEWRVRLDAVNITGPEDTEAIAEAKDIFIGVRDEILVSERNKKIIKDPYLKPGQLIDGVFKVYTDEMMPLKRAAEAKAKYVENLDRERKEQVRKQRELELTPYVLNIAAFDLHPDQMIDEAFETILNTSKELHANREANRKRYEAELQRLEDDAAAERVKLRRQTERRTELSTLGFTRDPDNSRFVLEDLSVYDQDIEGEITETWSSRIDRLKPKAEAIRVSIKAKSDAAAKVIADQAEADRLAMDADARSARDKEAAELAPDKVKLEKLADQIDQIEFFATSNSRINDILGELRGKLTSATAQVRSQIKQLP